MANILEIIVSRVLSFFLYFHGNWFFRTCIRVIRAVLSFIEYKACINVPKSDESTLPFYILLLFVKNLLVYHGLKHEISPRISLFLLPSVFAYYSIQTVTMEHVRFHLDPWSLTIIILPFCWYQFWNLKPIEALSIVTFTALAYLLEEHASGYQFTVDLFLVIIFFKCIFKSLSDYRYAVFPHCLWFFALLIDQFVCWDPLIGTAHFGGLVLVNYAAYYRFQDERFSFGASIASFCFFYFVYGLAKSIKFCPKPRKELPFKLYQHMYKLFGLDDSVLKFIIGEPELESSPTTTAIPHIAQQAM